MPIPIQIIIGIIDLFLILYLVEKLDIFCIRVIIFNFFEKRRLEKLKIKI
jgi:hypothetical protein